MRQSLACGILLLAVSAGAYAQFGPGPAVPKQQGYGELRPHAWIRGFLGHNAASATTTVLNPSQINGAYGSAGTGQGVTVAIVDAYDATNAAADLATFMTQFGISCSTGGGTFTKVNEHGAASPLPAKNSGWEVEENLDVQWVRALAPCANIVLVEANSSNTSDLLTAVSTASSLGSVVSMSWGGSEFSGETSYDSYFLKSGVTFLASSGDTGGIVEWPSSSVNVIGVGGTNLALNTDGTVASETAWSGSGGGCSTQEPKIAAQAGFSPSSCAKRTAPDVSMDGGNLSPVYVYISDQGGWYEVYGTSLAVQLWAGVIAQAQGLSNAPLNGVLADLYTDAAGAPSSTLYVNNFRDITSGTAGSFSAGSGYDLVTGLGSPLVSTLVPNYLATQGSAENFSVSVSGSQTVAAGGTTANYTLTDTPINGFSGTVSWTFTPVAGITVNAVSGLSGSPATFTLTAAANLAAGTYSIPITGTGVYNSIPLTHSTTATLVVSAPTFSLSITPASQTVSHPASGKTVTATYTVKVTPVGAFTNKVALTVSGGITGVTPTITGTNPVTPGGTGTLTVTVSNYARTGTQSLTLTVTGSAAGTSNKTATATLVY